MFSLLTGDIEKKNLFEQEDQETVERDAHREHTVANYNLLYKKAC